MEVGEETTAHEGELTSARQTKKSASQKESAPGGISSI
jgi:hypothetical protein